MTTRKKNQQTVRGSSAKLSPFAQRLFAAWQDLGIERLDAAIVIAVSGGADSTALLLATEELLAKRRLQVNLVVAHLDHGLRKQSRDDARWVQNLATSLGLETINNRVDVAKRAKMTSDNLEQAARRARYDFLSKAAAKVKAHFVLTAHTMDDQAETVLLRLLRGSGADGIAGIEPVRRLHSRSNVLLVRPLLNWARRADTEDYCCQRMIEYLADPMNKDEQFARVRVRRQLLPLMASFNARIVEALARTSQLLRDELDVLSGQADRLLQQASSSRIKSETNPPPLDVRVLAEAPVAVRRRALRQWISNGRGDLRRCELAHIQGIEKLLVGEQGGRVAELPGGDKIVRNRGRITLVIKTR